MPLHEYECEKCGHRFEAIQKFSDPPLENCPKCGGHVHKLISAPAFHLKGSGWYITDYAKKDKDSKPDSTKDGASAAKTDKPAEGTKTETSTKSEDSTKKSEDSKPSAPSSEKSGT